MSEVPLYPQPHSQVRFLEKMSSNRPRTPSGEGQCVSPFYPWSPFPWRRVRPGPGPHTEALGLNPDRFPWKGARRIRSKADSSLNSGLCRSELGTYKTVTAIFWPCLCSKSP